MHTRCPYPECGVTWDADYELPENDWHWKLGQCPTCQKTARMRPLEVLENIDRLYAKRLNTTGIAGGPALDTKSVIFSALVEDVRSLWNVGSMFRTADGAGVAKLYLCGITGFPPRKELSKTSLGAEDTVAWEFHKGAVSVLQELKASSVQIIGLERSSLSIALATACERQLVKAPVCLAVGNEVMGLSAEVLSLCDLVCHLPMRGTKESLNAAVAFGIACYSIAEKFHYD